MPKSVAAVHAEWPHGMRQQTASASRHGFLTREVAYPWPQCVGRTPWKRPAIAVLLKGICT